MSVSAQAVVHRWTARRGHDPSLYTSLPLSLSSAALVIQQAARRRAGVRHSLASFLQARMRLWLQMSRRVGSYLLRVCAYRLYRHTRAIAGATGAGVGALSLRSLALPLWRHERLVGLVAAVLSPLRGDAICGSPRDLKANSEPSSPAWQSRSPLPSSASEGCLHPASTSLLTAARRLGACCKDSSPRDSPPLPRPRPASTPCPVSLRSYAPLALFLFPSSALATLIHLDHSQLPPYPPHISP